DPTAPAAEYRYRDGGGSVGVIASVSRPFCHHCNRLRLTADGKLRNCLFALDETDAKALLRAGPDTDPAIPQLIRRSVWAKVAGAKNHPGKSVAPAPTHARNGGIRIFGLHIWY